MEFLPIATIIYKRVEIIIGEDNKIENFSDLMGLILEKTRELTYDIPEISNEFEHSKEE